MGESQDMASAKMWEHQRSEHPIPLSSHVKLGLACLAVAGIVAWINRHHDIQSGIYNARYQVLARFLVGEGEQPIITYPLWGYPWLLSWLPYPEITSITLQLIVSTIALVLVYSSAAPYLRLRAPLVTLTVIAVPWYALASVKLADIYAASFGVMAICLLARAVKTQALRWSIASGLLFGASVNFRSDFLPFLATLPVLTLVLSPRTALSNWRRLLIVIVLSVVSLVPWGLFRVYHGKSFGITSTNAGMVLYNSVGFPGNAWGIISSDNLRSREVKEALGAGVDPASEKGNKFFRGRFLAAVMSDPLEFGRKISYNFVATLKGGFYGIEIEPFLGEEERLELEVLKEQLKVRAGANQNLVDIEEFRDLGLWDEDFSLTSVTLRQWVIAAYPIMNVGLSAVYLVALLAAIVRIVLFERTRLREPIFLFCLIGAVYVFSLISLIQYEPRQANVLYPLGIPLIVVLVEWMGGSRNAVLRNLCGTKS